MPLLARKPGDKKASGKGVFVVQASPVERTLSVKPQRTAETADARSAKSLIWLLIAALIGLTAVALTLLVSRQWVFLLLPALICLGVGMVKKFSAPSAPETTDTPDEEKSDNKQEEVTVATPTQVKTPPPPSSPPKYRLRLTTIVLLAVVVSTLVFKLATLFHAWWIHLAGTLFALLLAYLIVRVTGRLYAGLSVGRAAPKRGAARRLHVILNTLRIPYIPPRGTSEQLDAEIAAEEDRHYELMQSWQDRKAIRIGVMGTMGGVGCSTVASNTAELSAEQSHLKTFLGDWRFGMGNLVQRFGFLPYSWGVDASIYDPKRCPTIRQCIQMMKRKQLVTSTRRQHLLRSSRKCNLTLMAADGPSTSDGQSVKRAKFEVSDGIKVLDIFSRDHSLMLIEGNNDAGEDLDLALASWVDLHWFVTRTNMPFADDDLEGMLETYRSESPELKQTIDDFGHLVVLATTSKHTRKEYADRFGFPESRVFMIPKNVYFELTNRIERIAKLGEKQVPEPIISTATMPRDSKLEYLRLLNSSVEMLILAFLQFKEEKARKQAERLAALTTARLAKRQEKKEEAPAPNGSSDEPTANPEGTETDVSASDEQTVQASAGGDSSETPGQPQDPDESSDSEDSGSANPAAGTINGASKELQPIGG